MSGKRERHCGGATLTKKQVYQERNAICVKREKCTRRQGDSHNTMGRQRKERSVKDGVGVERNA